MFVRYAVKGGNLPDERRCQFGPNSGIRTSDHPRFRCSAAGDDELGRRAKRLGARHCLDQQTAELLPPIAAVGCFPITIVGLIIETSHSEAIMLLGWWLVGYAIVVRFGIAYGIAVQA
ncbi:hypothetical protein [Bradyrhizobium jicamae]|uniref:hypothetical protein n=1 Tax=Bradyrhizobium jicamae TaxID=280332 RepID=UPI001BA96488|nr:hypothetical protein [Bradyrhizobium jicamae]MBR0939055.1 hypothetical protein [Bradyrhizobium jicamae]